MKQTWPANSRAMFRRIIAVAFVLCAGGRAEAEVITNWTRHFRLGAVVGLNLSADFKMNGQFNISGSRQPGVYDDGYVLMDNTGNAGGYTSFWGYKNTSQYNAADQSLTFHNASAFSLTDNTHADSTAQAGLDLVYGGKIMNSGDALVGWEFGFMWMPINVEDDRELSTTFNRTASMFDTGDIVMPEAPYNGGASGIGPTIRDLASPGLDEPAQGMITGSRKLDVMLYNFRLGPSMHWEVNPWFAFSIGGGAALGLATCEYRYKETIQLADGGRTPNRGSFDNTEVVYGSYANVTLMFHTVEQADIFIGAQFMALDKVEASSEGRRASLDLGTGFYLSAGVNWPF